MRLAYTRPLTTSPGLPLSSSTPAPSQFWSPPQGSARIDRTRRADRIQPARGTGAVARFAKSNRDLRITETLNHPKTDLVRRSGRRDAVLALRDNRRHRQPEPGSPADVPKYRRSLTRDGDLRLDPHSCDDVRHIARKRYLVEQRKDHRTQRAGPPLTVTGSAVRERELSLVETRLLETDSRTHGAFAGDRIEGRDIDNRRVVGDDTESPTRRLGTPLRVVVPECHVNARRHRRPRIPAQR